MKTKLITLTFLAVVLGVLPGCVSLPPLLVIQHKEKTSDQAVAKRLDAIDQRLNHIEKSDAK